MHACGLAAAPQLPRGDLAMHHHAARAWSQYPHACTCMRLTLHCGRISVLAAKCAMNMAYHPRQFHQLTAAS